jgi:hypothetical protein
VRPTTKILALQFFFIPRAAASAAQKCAQINVWRALLVSLALSLCGHYCHIIIVAALIVSFANCPMADAIYLEALAKGGEF